MRIWHISDLHLEASEANNKVAARIVELATLHRPEVVILTGDLMDTPSAAAAEYCAELIGRMTAQDIKVIGVPGNHDLYARGIDYGQAPSYAHWDTIAKAFTAPNHVGKFGLRRWELYGVGFIGLDTCKGNADRRPDLARGCIGEYQRMELALHLLSGDVVFGHHRAFWHDQAHLLEDREQLISRLTRARAAAYLCGHEHKRHMRRHDEVLYLAARRSTQLERGLVIFDELESRSMAIKTLELAA